MSSLDGKGQITVCVGNYGYYNEGELHDAWIDLPKSREEIHDFLVTNRLYDAMHEETYISDYDGIPLGMSYGEAFSEYTSLDDLNLLARAMEGADPRDLERLKGAFEAGADQPRDVIGVVNLVAQADEVPYQEYRWKPGAFDAPGVRTPEEAFALTYLDDLGGPTALGRDVMERYFDVESYGRDRRIASVYAGDEGWCWRDGVEGPDPDAFDTVADAAEDMGVDAGDLDFEVDVAGEGKAPLMRPASALTSEEVRDVLAREVGYSPDRSTPPTDLEAADERALLAMADDLDDFDREAVRAFVDANVTYPTMPAELASVIALHDQIDYRHYVSDAADLDVRVGETFIEEYGFEDMSDDDLAAHFDYESYGRDARYEGVCLGEEGYLDGDMPNDSLYTRSELEEMYPDPSEAVGVDGPAEGLAPTASALLAQAVAARPVPGDAHAPSRVRKM